ncbi:site-specific DNA-methyltransferase [Patescibacteria group bacterium]
MKDGEIDFDALKKFFKDEEVLAGEEKFGLSWAGKNEAFRAIRKKSTGTLSPQEDESKNWDDTQNLFIEGDNLESLKLLQKHYREKIKMIYIDPPYNTGKDFIYKDNFKENISDYYEKTGQSESGVKLTTNPETAGRYHSDWLTMMYPRLFLARNLLKEDGVIFVSIDDNEVANLRLIMDEIFGEENFVGCIVLKTATDNNKTQIKSEHEYIISYAKSKEIQGYWERPSDAANLIREQFNHLKNLYGEDLDKIQKELRKWIRKNKNKLPKASHYDNVDSSGVFHDADIANTKFDGYFYDVLHPKTKKVCKIPEKGFRFPQETMMRMIKENNILFGDKENILIKPKKRLEDVRDALRSVIYEDGRGSTKILENLFDIRGIFDNPKSHSILLRLIDFVVNKDSNDIVLDFFAGSGTTAHAVMGLNAEDGGDRKFIMVQIPETVDEKSEAKKAGFENIAQISRERIRRAGEKILKDKKEEIEKRKKPLDTGFKSFVLQKSNYRQWETMSKENTKEEILEQSKLFVEKPLIDGFDENSVVFEILLKEGFDLNSEIEKKKIGDLEVYFSSKKNDEGIEKKIAITFSEKVTQDQARELNLKKEDIFVCFDFALDDSIKVNIGREFDLKVI